MNNRYCKEIIKDYIDMNKIMIGFWISYGIFFIYFIIYFIYLMLTLKPWYKISKEEETIAIYLGIITICLTIVFLINIYSEL